MATPTQPALREALMSLSDAEKLEMAVDLFRSVVDPEMVGALGVVSYRINNHVQDLYVAAFEEDCA